MALRWYTTVIDAHDIATLSRWWAQTLDWQIVYEDDGRSRSSPSGWPRTGSGTWPSGCAPARAWSSSPSPRARRSEPTPHRPAPHKSQDRDAEVAALPRARRHHADVGQSDDVTWTVLADPEGNEFCVPPRATGDRTPSATSWPGCGSSPYRCACASARRHPPRGRPHRGAGGVGRVRPLSRVPAGRGRPVARLRHRVRMPRGRPLRDSVPVSATIPAIPPDAVAAVLQRFPGCTTAKVKVAEAGQMLADDLDRVAAVRDAMGPSARIRVDANGGWSLTEATDAVGRLAAYDLGMWSNPAHPSRNLPTCESAGAQQDRCAHRCRRGRSARPRIPCGSVTSGSRPGRRQGRSPRWRRQCPAHRRRCGLPPAVVSSALDTSVGISAGVALAAALPASTTPVGSARWGSSTAMSRRTLPSRSEGCCHSGG